jgi:ribosomal-protein-alanine N-acetyltransferase
MGDGLPAFQEQIAAFQKKMIMLNIDVDPGNGNSTVIQDARAVLAWAVSRGLIIDYEELDPIYMRKAEAQRRLDEKNEGQNEDGSSYKIRRATENDVYGISVIERLSFGEPWLEQSILNDLLLEYSDYVVCEKDGFIMGYAGLHRILEEGHITNIAVHPSVRRQGIGEAALEKLMTIAEEKGIRAFTLEVRDSDEVAIGFYEKQGFVSEGVRKDYYPKEGGGREDARLMWRRGTQQEAPAPTPESQLCPGAQQEQSPLCPEGSE